MEFLEGIYITSLDFIVFLIYEFVKGKVLMSSFTRSRYINDL